MMNKYQTIAELFADPARWTQGCEARDANGKEVLRTDPDAVCWCLFAATRLVYPFPKCSDVYDQLNLALVSSGEMSSVVLWNDDPKRVHAQVLELVTKEQV